MLPEHLTSEMISLDRFERRDVGRLHEAVTSSLAELAVWLPWAQGGYGRDQAFAYVRESARAWREGRAWDYAMHSPTLPGVHLGNASIWPISRQSHTGEIGYWVRSDMTGRGIATEATRLLLDAGFDRLGLHRITLRIAVGNAASRRVAEKLGFTLEGILREELLIGDRWVDHYLFSMLEREWSQRSSRLS